MNIHLRLMKIVSRDAVTRLEKNNTRRKKGQRRKLERKRKNKQIFILPTAADELLATPVSDRREAPASGEGKTLEMPPMPTVVAEDAEEEPAGAVETTLLLPLPPFPAVTLLAGRTASDDCCCCCCCCC